MVRAGSNTLLLKPWRLVSVLDVINDQDWDGLALFTEEAPKCVAVFS